jgi:hypothetical protein
MRFGLQGKKTGRRVRRVGMEMGRTLSVASQMALLCPSGMDVWMQRELSGHGEPLRHPAAPRR